MASTMMLQEQLPEERTSTTESAAPAATTAIGGADMENDDDEEDDDVDVTHYVPPTPFPNQPTPIASRATAPRPRLRFTADVQHAIEHVLRSTDPLDAADFDATAYINQLFPTEQSLAGIDAIIGRMERDIGSCDAHIRGVVRGQADAVGPTATTTIALATDAGSASAAELDGHEALRAAQVVIGALCTQIGDIKRRAEHTEDTVRQITRDIKQLDCAKRNLTAAITTLNHLHMLVGGVESLVRLVERRQYAELVNPLQAITEVNEHFAPYVGRIAQIGELSGRVVGIHRELAGQIAADFRAVFGSGAAGEKSIPQQQQQVKPVAKLTAAQLADACKVVAVLDRKVRRDLLKWFIALQLEEYAQLFHDNQDIAWLDRIDKRYAWLKRHLLDFEDRHGRIFPADWEVSERIAVRFCQMTRDQLRAIVSRRRAEVDVKLLLFAIAKTAAFELLLAKRFAGVTLRVDVEISADVGNNASSSNAAATTDAATADASATTGEQPSPFVDLIGSCFKPYLDIYTDSIDRSLADILERFVVDARTAAAGTSSSSAAAVSAAFDAASSGATGDSPVYPSCADLFVFYKKCMVQCAQLSCGQPLLDLTAIFKRYLREYTARLLDAQLAALATPGGGGGGGGSTSVSVSTFGAIASSAAAAATSSTKDHLQHLTTTAGHVLHNLLKEKPQDGGHSPANPTSGGSGSGSSSNNNNHNNNSTTVSNSAPTPTSTSSTSAANIIDPATAGRYTRVELRRLCCVLATAEYCLETVQQLEDKLREKIDGALSARVDLGDECDGFHRIIAHCIQLLVTDVVAGCDVALAAMVRIQWQQVSTVGDQSAYVSQLAATLRHTVPHVRDNLAASRKYYTQFCLKFVTAFMPKFVAALYRCRPATEAPNGATSNQYQVAVDAAAVVGTSGDEAAAAGTPSAAIGAEVADIGGAQPHHNIMGCEQLLLDTHSIKTLLLELPSIGSQVRRKAPASYTKVVLRGMSQPEAIVKLVMSSAAGAQSARAYADQYVRMLPASSVPEFGRVLEMRGISRRADQAPLVEAYRRVVAAHQHQQQLEQQQQQQQQQAASFGFETTSTMIAADPLNAADSDATEDGAAKPPPVAEMGHMRKLEALIKKRLPN